MHTAATLRPEMFQARLNDAPAAMSEVLPGWDAASRLGVIVREPLGALGAALLIQLAICAYFEARAGRRGPTPHYPEVYALHVGGRFGALGALDFWPPRKELFVDADELLPTINTLAITHLAAPVRVGSPPSFAYKEPEAALDRMRQGYLYSPTGRMADADLAIASAAAPILADIETAIDPEPRLVEIEAEPRVGGDPVRDADRERFLRIMRRRLAEVPSDRRRAVAAARRRLLSPDGRVEEAYRTVSPGEILSHL